MTKQSIGSTNLLPITISPIVLSSSASRDQAYVIDVTDIVKKEFETGHTLWLRFFYERDTECAAVFYSSEGIYPQLRPKLALEYKY